MRFDEKTITINHHDYLLSGYDSSDYYKIDIIPDYYDMFEDGMACNGVAFCYDMGDTIDVHYKVSITPKGKNKSKVVLDEKETINKEDFDYINDSAFAMICEWIDNRYGKELFESKKITKRSLKESHGFDEENEYMLGLTVATNERVLEDTFESEGLDVDWNYISKVSAELDFTIERKFAKEIDNIAVEEFHDDEGYHCTFWVRYDDAKVMKYLNNLRYVDDYRYSEFTSKLVDVDEICDNEIDKLEKKYDDDILGILRECVSVWIEVPNKIA